MLNVLRAPRELATSAALRRWAVLALVAVTVTYSIMYTAIQYFNSDNYAGNSDALGYMKFAREGKLEGARRSKQFRILTPMLVRTLPDPPAGLFSRYREIDEEWLLKIKFALVNGVFLTGAALLLAYYMQRVGFSYVESLVGLLLFLTSLTVVYAGAIPLVDAGFYFFIALSAVALAMGSGLLFGLALVAGLFNKEALILVMVFALLFRPRQWRRWVLAAVPAVALYLAWRLANSTGSSEALGHLDPANVIGQISGIPGLFRPNKLMDLFSSFGLLWIPALYALKARLLPTSLERSYLWLPVLFVVSLVLGGGPGRTLFIAFPVVIPSAVAGLRRLWEATRTPAQASTGGG